LHCNWGRGQFHLKKTLYSKFIYRDQCESPGQAIQLGDGTIVDKVTSTCQWNGIFTYDQDVSTNPTLRIRVIIFIVINNLQIQNLF
jgi:hypothetical protein